MANNMMTLLTSAAEMRSGGVSWEMIGAILNRSANTCRQWPNRYPEEWKNLYAQAEEERWQEAGHEAVATLRRLLHDENPRIQIQSASHLIKWSMFHKKLEVQQGIDPNRTYYDVNHFVAEEDDSPYVPLTERIPKHCDPLSVPEATTASIVGTAAACFLLLLCFSWQAFARSDAVIPNHSIVASYKQDVNPNEQRNNKEDPLVRCSASNEFTLLRPVEMSEGIRLRASNESVLDSVDTETWVECDQANLQTVDGQLLKSPGKQVCGKPLAIVFLTMRVRSEAIDLTRFA